MEATMERMETEEKRNTFYELQNGVRLYRFAGEKIVRLIGKRPATDAVPAAVYEIFVDKPAHKACAIIEGNKIFEIEAFVGSGKVEVMALSALHRFVKERQEATARKKARKVRAREAAAGAAEAEPFFTPQEVLETARALGKVIVNPPFVKEVK